MHDAARAIAPEIVVLCHGGPIAEPDDAAFERVMSKAPDYRPELYAAGAWGPKAADQLLQRSGRRWHEPASSRES